MKVEDSRKKGKITCSGNSFGQYESGWEPLMLVNVVCINPQNVFAVKRSVIILQCISLDNRTKRLRDQEKVIPNPFNFDIVLLP